MITYQEFKAALVVVSQYKVQLEEQLKAANKEMRYANVTKESVVSSTNLPVRAYNILKNNHEALGLPADIVVNDLSKLSAKLFLSCNNSGKKSLKDIQELCLFAGVTMPL